MNATAWERSPLRDDALVAQAVETFQAIHRDHFLDDPAINPALPIVARAFRHDGGWQVFLLLTPWMLGRLFFPSEAPDLPLPVSKTVGGDGDGGAQFALLGPPLAFRMHGEHLRAHLHHRPELGHFMIQPLVMNMDRFSSEEAVFDAWSEVIRTRDEMMATKRRTCGWQKELSRREMFAGLLTSARRKT